MANINKKEFINVGKAFIIVASIVIMSILESVPQSFGLAKSPGESPDFYVPEVLFYIIVVILLAVIFGGVQVLLENYGLKLKKWVLNAMNIIALSPFVYMTIKVLHAMITVDNYYSYGLTLLVLITVIVTLSWSMIKELN